jgi:hypothetical protein
LTQIGCAVSWHDHRIKRSTPDIKTIRSLNIMTVQIAARPLRDHADTDAKLFSADVHSPIAFFRQPLCLPTLLVSNFDTSVRKCANVLGAFCMAGSGADLAQALSAYEAERCPATRRIVRQNRSARHPT